MVGTKNMPVSSKQLIQLSSSVNTLAGHCQAAELMSISMYHVVG